MSVDTAHLVIDALHQLGVKARPPTDTEVARADLLLDPDGVAAPLDLKRRSLVDRAVARDLIAHHLPCQGILLVVGDRVTEDARDALLAAKAGYYDLRGHLGLRSDRIVVRANVEAVTPRASRVDALSGKAGLEVATALLLSPDRTVPVRQLARDLKRSPSTVSEVMGALRRDGLVDPQGNVTDSRLFWLLVDRWPTGRTYLARTPTATQGGEAKHLRLGLEDIDKDPGWALTDSAAAAAFGAPVAMRAGQTLDFFVPDTSTLRRAMTLLGPVDPSVRAACTIRVAPVPAACDRRIRSRNDSIVWPLAHPLFVALDLAQDHDRGRVVLDAWLPSVSPEWTRVW